MRPASPYPRTCLLALAVAVAAACVGSGSGSNPNNQPPEFSATGLTLSASVLMPEGSVTVSSHATDPDGDPLTYTWAEATGGGTFEAAATGDACTWHAPSAEGVYEVRVTARDPAGHTAVLASTVEVTTTLHVPSESYPTIQSALDAAQTGMTVAVAAGIYTEDLTVKEAVHLQGAGAATTVVHGTGTDAVLAPEFSSAAGIIVEGLTLEGGSTGVDVSAAADFTLRDCVVRDNSTSGIALFSAPARIENCRITGNSGNGIEIRSSAATVQGCVIADNAGYGVEITTSGATLRFTTIADNVGAGIRIYQSNATLRDSIVAANDLLNFNAVTLLGASGVSIANAQPLLSHLLLFHNQLNIDATQVNGDAVVVDGSYVTGDGGELSGNGDPLLADDGSYTLGASSPALTLATGGGELGAYGGGFAPPLAP